MGSLTKAHAQKVYFAGTLVYNRYENPSGKEEGWRDIWAQLCGTTLGIRDRRENEEAAQQGKEDPPWCVNVAEVVRPSFHLHYRRDSTKLSSQHVDVFDGVITQPATPTSSLREYTNVITLNTGVEILAFSCPSIQDLVSWVAAFRLSSWEKSRLEEMYTAHLIRTTINGGRNVPSTLTDGRLEGWVMVRIARQTDWKRLWMCVSTGTTTDAISSSIGVAPIDPRSIQTSGRNRRPLIAPKIRFITGILSRRRQRADRQKVVPTRANISFYDAPREESGMKPLLAFEAVTQAFAVHPE
jgi:CCR4-NOT transcriptional complex subunit CAF120